MFMISPLEDVRVHPPSPPFHIQGEEDTRVERISNDVLCNNKQSWYVKGKRLNCGKANDVSK